jgi:hypothetical protein
MQLTFFRVTPKYLNILEGFVSYSYEILLYFADGAWTPDSKSPEWTIWCCIRAWNSSVVSSRMGRRAEQQVRAATVPLRTNASQNGRAGAGGGGGGGGGDGKLVRQDPRRCNSGAPVPGPRPGPPDTGLSWSSSVHPGKIVKYCRKWGRGYFQIPSNPLFAHYSIMRC